jgi:hypothetical protein
MCYTGCLRSFSKLKRRYTNKLFRQIFCKLKCMCIFLGPLYFHTKLHHIYSPILCILFSRIFIRIVIYSTEVSTLYFPRITYICVHLAQDFIIFIIETSLKFIFVPPPPFILPYFISCLKTFSVI